uniref:Retrovirus-related Pol polyprotein from transposon TNT 1-94-like beta-barrel domain-containing protein n=1 Tax=Timema douglasi TaxID=61478 RepID=A0A7R8VH47_TIMDO|nr:unnamed protein product [Timema douglasi]
MKKENSRSIGERPVVLAWFSLNLTGCGNNNHKQDIIMLPARFGGQTARGSGFQTIQGQSGVQNQNRNFKASKRLYKCNYCKKSGHKAADCWTKMANEKQVSMASEQTHAVAEEIVTLTSSSVSALCAKLTRRDDVWCVDSGATTHMCRDKNSFLELTPTISQKVSVKDPISNADGHVDKVQESDPIDPDRPIEVNENDLKSENLSKDCTVIENKRGPGRPKLIKTGKPGRPAKHFNLVNTHQISILNKIFKDQDPWIYIIVNFTFFGLGHFKLKDSSKYQDEDVQRQERISSSSFLSKVYIYGKEPAHDILAKLFNTTQYNTPKQPVYSMYIIKDHITLRALSSRRKFKQLPIKHRIDGISRVTCCRSWTQGRVRGFLFFFEMSINPILRTPFTDITSTVLVHRKGKCTPLELRMLNCFEAYGIERGKTLCNDILEDFHECCTHKKQLQRTYAMQAERDRQYKAGERSKEDRYAKTPIKKYNLLRFLRDSLF